MYMYIHIVRTHRMMCRPPTKTGKGMQRRKERRIGL